MAQYRIRKVGADGKIKAAETGIACEESSAFAAAQHYLAAEGRSGAGKKDFILLYTEKDKNPGWECFFRGKTMFAKPPHCFVEKLS